MNDIKILICGGRHFNEYEVFCKTVKSIIEELKIELEEIELVSGGCEGTDKMAERFAEDNGIPIKVFLPDWKRYGKAAGPIRNRQMIVFIKDFDFRYVIAFTSDKSRGTRNTIDLAKKNNIEVYEFDYHVLLDDHENA